MKAHIARAACFLAWSWQAAWGQSVSWEKRPGSAVHIAGNAEGSLWAVGTDRDSQTGFNVYKFNGTSWVRNSNAPASRRLGVGMSDQLWIVDDANALYMQSGASRLLLPSSGRDIAVGGDGSVWIIGADKRSGGYGIYKRVDSNWTNISGAAARVAVEKDGTPWVVNEFNDVFRYNTSAARWDRKPGKATSIYTGAASGAVWMLGTELVAGGYPIYQWNPSKQNWDPYGTYGAVAITEAAGTPWIVQSDGSIYSKAAAITVTTINISLTPPPQTPTPQPQAPLRVQGSGKLLCSNTGLNACGDTKADYVGAYSLNLTCNQGFYDLIWGGTCWKCPDETDSRGAWIRSADPIDRDTACWRVPKETVAHATKVRSPSWAWDCPSGSFWDIYSPDGIGGSCWKCPDDNPRRTAAAVWSFNACASSLNETKPAIFLTFNGCPTPNAATMNLPAKRSPGKPFLDVLAGWSQGVASGGCYTCPVTDEAGNFLITDRNANPLYDRDGNTGCTVKLKWQPPPFNEPGLAYMQGVKDIIWEQKLFDGDRFTGFLYDLAETQELGDATPEAKAWVTARWQEIAKNPYKSESLRTFVFALLKAALLKKVDDRTPGERKLIQSFANYIRDRRIYLAEQGLAMYDAWKAYDDQYRQESGQTKSLSQLFYYGTVPLDFHGTLGSLVGLGGVGAGVAGGLVAANQFANNTLFIKVLTDTGFAWRTQETMNSLTSGLSLLKSAQGVTLLSGAAVIQLAGAILTSIAIDQFIAIESARPKLEASLAQAKEPVDLNTLVKATNGEDMLYFYWAKAMDTSDIEDQQVVQLAAQAQARAHQSGYVAPPKKPLTQAELIRVIVDSATSPGDTISSGTGTASPFSDIGLKHGEKLVSRNGNYHAIMQPDGNFVIYEDYRAVWSTQTHGKGRPPYRLAMQPDGNLVIYGSSDKDATIWAGLCRANSACHATWASGIAGGTAPFRLTMQNDRNLVIYDSSNRAVWSSRTQR